MLCTVSHAKSTSWRIDLTSMEKEVHSLKCTLLFADNNSLGAILKSQEMLMGHFEWLGSELIPIAYSVNVKFAGTQVHMETREETKLPFVDLLAFLVRSVSLSYLEL